MLFACVLQYLKLHWSFWDSFLAFATCLPPTREGILLSSLHQLIKHDCFPGVSTTNFFFHLCATRGVYDFQYHLLIILPKLFPLTIFLLRFSSRTCHPIGHPEMRHLNPNHFKGEQFASPLILFASCTTSLGDFDQQPSYQVGRNASISSLVCPSVSIVNAAHTVASSFLNS